MGEGKCEKKEIGGQTSQGQTSMTETIKTKLSEINKEKEERIGDRLKKYEFEWEK